MKINPIIYIILHAILVHASCDISNDNKGQNALKDVSTREVLINDNQHIIISQILGEDSLYVQMKTGSEVINICSFPNPSLSESSIPDASISVKKIDGREVNNIIYFINESEFLLGLLGVSKALNLYVINVKTKNSYDYGIRTLNSKFYIDEKTNTLITSSYLREQDSLFIFDINRYSTDDLVLKNRRSYIVHQKEIDSVLNLNLFGLFP